MNLAVNARDAMPHGGRLSFALSSVLVDEQAHHEAPEVRPGRFVQLIASDNGCGMDATLVDRIFEPFFTTKPLGRGTGLGLSVVYGIVRHSGGFIEVRSKPGHGTTFVIHLPRVEGEPPLAPRISPERVGGTEAILLVEDEPMVLRVTQRLLERLGYRVYVAMRGDDALAMMEAGLEFDLLLTDALLPGLDGHQLYRRARTLRPRLPVVFMSGHPGSEIDEYVVREGVGYLQKPFTHDDLAAKIRASLDARGRLNAGA